MHDCWIFCNFLNKKYNSPIGIQARDFSIVAITEDDDPLNKYISAKSVVNSMDPEKKNIVRGEVLLAGWFF